MSVHICSPTGCVHCANFVGATTVPTKVPPGWDWTATSPPLKDQTRSMGEVALAEAIRTEAPRISSISNNNNVIIAAVDSSSDLERFTQTAPSAGRSPNGPCDDIAPTNASFARFLSSGPKTRWLWAHGP